MVNVLTNAQMRAADEYTIGTLGVSSETLMKRAGLAVAEEVMAAVKERNAQTVTVVCGTGNNGGDGYVCAQALKKNGVNVSVYALEGKLSADCQREKARYKGKTVTKIGADVIVDCIFGTGLSRTVSGEFFNVIREINESGAYVVSVDIPSGVNGDNGRMMGAAVRADKTVAIAEYKLGHFLGDGVDCAGELTKKDIGIALPEGEYAKIYEEKDIAASFPKRRRNTHKGNYGSANLVAGSAKYRGAAALCVAAALRSGCGYVKLSSCEEVISALVGRYPQVIYLNRHDLSSDAIAIGMGSGMSRELYIQMKLILKSFAGKLIIDADGCNSLAEYGADILAKKHCEVLLTPHVKEFSRLSGLAVGDILNDPVGCAANFAQEYGVTVLLKNAVSVVTDGVKTAINVRGDTSLAQGGSGDMLSGLICGVAARGTDVFGAAVTANYVLGSAAELASAELTPYCTVADDVIKNIPKVVKRLTNLSGG